MTVTVSGRTSSLQNLRMLEDKCWQSRMEKWNLQVGRSDLLKQQKDTGTKTIADNVLWELEGWDDVKTRRSRRRVTASACSGSLTPAEAGEGGDKQLP